jgi:hypothetical protein
MRSCLHNAYGSVALQPAVFPECLEGRLGVVISRLSRVLCALGVSAHPGSRRSIGVTSSTGPSCAGCLGRVFMGWLGCGYAVSWI